jgi:prophage tail gpP-like protein
MANGTPQKTGFPFTNRAVVTIDGQQYYQWESVQVRAALYENTRTFRLTVSEQKPTPRSYAAMQIVPGMKCTVELDGYLAITGEVITRQVFYDANQHVVEIQGQGLAGRMANASVVSQTGEWNNIGFQELMQTLAKPFGVGVMGTAQSAMKFPRVSVTPGESPWELGERHARAAQTPMSENAQGQIKLGSEGGGASVIEGYNILEGREVIHSLASVGGSAVGGGAAPGEGSDFTTIGQRPGTDDAWGADPNRVNAEKPAVTTDFNAGNLPKVEPTEIPAWTQDMAGQRSNMEAMYSDTLQIWVNITLLTWQRSGKAPPAGGLWEPGDMVTVMSPMLVMFGQQLKLKTVTWSQDNTSGTRSQIELVNSKAETPSSVPGGQAPQ